VADTNYAITLRCVLVRLSTNEAPVAVLFVNDEENRMRTLEDVRANVRFQVPRSEAAHGAF
jgi:hypothetical protein